MYLVFGTLKHKEVVTDGLGASSTDGLGAGCTDGRGASSTDGLGVVGLDTDGLGAGGDAGNTDELGVEALGTDDIMLGGCKALQQVAASAPETVAPLFTVLVASFEQSKASHVAARGTAPFPSHFSSFGFHLGFSGGHGPHSFVTGFITG